MLRITEFLASNDGGLNDADGDDSDWIEIYNSGAQPVDLTGLHLTDDPSDLNRWSFPSGHQLDAGAFLVVFASGKDTVLAGDELHTDFKLGADGEYLALVDTDGSTIIDQFSPEFPPQVTDVSYGREMQPAGPTSVVLADGANARGLVPSNGALGVSWTSPGFNDAAWPLAGPTGYGYENNPGNNTNFTDEIATSIPSGTTSLYLRVPFTLNSLTDIGSLSLEMRYDDGFVAYLNGVKIASANEPETLNYASAASASHNDGLAEQFAAFNVDAAIPHLTTGVNVLAIHALNQEDSSDMLIEPRLVSRRSNITNPEAVGYFAQPTPGYGNSNNSILGFAQEPEFDLASGFYESTQFLSIVSGTPGATIVYTTDGSTPAVNGNLNVTNGVLYQSPISVSSTRVIRAAAFFPDFEPSATQTRTYIFVNDVIQQQPSGQAPGPGWPSSNVNGQDIDYGMDPEILALYGNQAVIDSLKSLSTVSITTDLENLFDSQTGIIVNATNRGRDWERPASLEIIYPDGSEAGFQIDAGLRIRGGASRTDNNPKHAFRFYFRSEYGESKLEYPLFGDEGVDKFDVLDFRTAQNYSWSYQGNSQNTFVRDVFSRDLQADLGQPYTRSRYHHLYVNGVYWGIFMTQERIEKYYGESYLGGDEDDYDVVKADPSVTRITEVADGNDLAWRALFDYAQDLADNPVANANNYFTMQGLNPDGSRNPALPVLLDLDNLIDYMAIIFYTGAYDNGISRFFGDNRSNNWFGIRSRENPDQGFQFFMHDAEHSLGANNTDSIDRTGPFNQGNQDNYDHFNPQYLHQDLLASKEYRVAFGDRIRNYFFDDGPMTAGPSMARMQSRVDEVDPAIVAEAARWGDSKREPAFNRNDWLGELSTLLDPQRGYFLTRTGTVLNQLIGDDLYPTIRAPAFSPYGGEIPAGQLLSISAPGLAIYYTTDGSDPRQIGGAISPSAQTYQGAVAIAATTTVKARAYVPASQTWSALTAADFVATVLGDYDSSGQVDQADYVVWSQSFGSTTQLAADGNGDGVVDSADYTVWRDQFSALAALAAMTPEPSAQHAAPAPQLSIATPKLPGALDPPEAGLVAASSATTQILAFGDVPSSAVYRSLPGRSLPGHPRPAATTARSIDAAFSRYDLLAGRLAAARHRDLPTFTPADDASPTGGFERFSADDPDRSTEPLDDSLGLLAEELAHAWRRGRRVE
ncbi:CotH protein [Pirellulimonas nuda]|uniref:CotH protein n=2 Tax=Pirellulimonas nuda TaxID=2528009 RepID=A0A518DDV1_9BACT|nr:CotH protein [Pirellulimonas nuda]